MNNNNMNNNSSVNNSSVNNNNVSSVNNSSSMEVSEIISSVDIDRDNCVADHISGSADEISGSF